MHWSVAAWMQGAHRCGWGVGAGVLLAAAALVAACTPKGTPPPTNPGSADAVPAPRDVRDTAGTDDDRKARAARVPHRDEPRCAAQGRPWDGKPTGCMYEHDGCCYPDPGALCTAAGCTADNCRILESRPAAASC